MNVMLMIKYSSTVKLGNRKLCECHTRIFINVEKKKGKKGKKMNEKETIMGEA